MFKNLLMTLAIVLATCTMTMAQAQGRLKGKITDDTGETVPFANVIVEKGGTQVGGTSSDFDGNYDINPIPPGTYDLKASCIGYNAFVVKNIVIPANKITFYDIKMTSGAINIGEVTIVDYEIPLISKDNTTQGASITSEEIAKLPVRSAEGVAASVGGVFSSDGEVGSIRGSREGAVYYIDGVKVIGSTSVPQSAIDQVDVILGGTPAMYGDAMGGIINMTTKGPSRTWGGGIEAEYSVDGYGHGRLGGSLQGPLIKSKKNDQEALLGFFLAFDITHNKYGYSSATGYWRAKDDYMDYIRTNPLTIGIGTNATAAYTQRDNLYHTRFLNNSTNQSVNLTGKIDVRTGKTTNLTLGGSMVLSGGHYPGGRSQYYFNTDKNYLAKSGTYRGYVRFTQRFQSDPNSTSLVSNVYYSIQADYSRFTSESGDPDLWDNLFAYGNLGEFTTYRAPNFHFQTTAVDSVLVNGEYRNLSNVFVLDNYYDTLVKFTPHNFNPDLATYAKNYFDLYEDYGAVGYYNNLSNIILNNGLINGMSPNYVYGLYAVPGTIQDSYGKAVNDQIALNVNGSMTLGRGDNSHDIKLGFQYEQQNNSQIAFSSNYWTLMRDMTNFHIRELDMDHPYANAYDGHADTVLFHRLYDDKTQYTFDYRLRQAIETKDGTRLPVDGTEWILIDTYDFDNNTIKYYDENGKMQTGKVIGGLDMSMFGADELTRDGNFSVYYYGYSYDGHTKYSLTERPTLSDFFNHQDSEDIFDRPIGAQQPIYMAGYLQDKFAFKDLIFNIGVRVDRFDANQQVLKDPYVLYDFNTVGDIKNAIANHALNEHNYNFYGVVSNIDIPDNIGDDYVPYVNKLSEIKEIVGYRNGNNWYDAEGVEISNPDVLDMGTGVSPWIKNEYIDKDKRNVDIKSFKDYDPAWSIMPRISFSFPISDEALFFAHYDVLTQRPTSAYYCSPLYYYRFTDLSGTVANPNLKPSQTIEYELGFTQKVTNTSSMTISAYYHELRNMIQMYRFNGAFPKAYNSYSNLDFGTVKGLTASYDMRRTKNARIRASYTLQFADMTGSSTGTAAALIAAGVPNLRSTFPTNADRRHSFNLTLDYRYADGKNYDGPTIKGVQFLSNTGFALQVNGGSGTPFTAARNVSSPISGGNSLLQGTYNGSRIPASFRFDLRVDKDFDFTIGGKKEGSRGREAFVNVYLQVLNLLNSKNIVGVYNATGNPDDDGYLSAPQWQNEINAQIDPQAYIQMYELFVNSGGNYSMPRHIRLGMSFNF